MSTLRNEQNITQSQKMMIFILAMAVFGLSELVLEIVPDLSVGPVDLGVSYFVFIPITLAALFAPAQVALGAVTGSVIFGSLLMGDFGGIGELESFIQLSLGIYLGGMLISNPLNKRQIFTSSILVVLVDKGIGSIVDILKIQIGVEEFEAVAGLPESILALEGLSLIEDVLISGIVFGALPAMYLIPKLYGKIEPLLGMKPRTSRPKADLSFLSSKNVIIALILVILSGVVAFLESADITFGVWEPDFIDQYGDAYLYGGIAIAVVFLVAVVMLIRKKSQDDYELD